MNNVIFIVRGVYAPLNFSIMLRQPNYNKIIAKQFLYYHFRWYTLYLALEIQLNKLMSMWLRL